MHLEIQQNTNLHPNEPQPIGNAAIGDDLIVD